MKTSDVPLRQKVEKSRWSPVDIRDRVLGSGKEIETSPDKVGDKDSTVTEESITGRTEYSKEH